MDGNRRLEHQFKRGNDYISFGDYNGTGGIGTQIIACLVGVYYTLLFVGIHYAYIIHLKRMSIYVTGPMYMIFIPILVVCLVLFYGAYEERPSFVLIWLICNAVTLIGALVVLVQVNSLFMYVGIAAGIVITILATVFSLYTWTAVYMYYLDLKERRNMPIEPTEPTDPVEQESEEETNNNNTETQV